jgi:hypothetical protein
VRTSFSSSRKSTRRRGTCCKRYAQVGFVRWRTGLIAVYGCQVAQQAQMATTRQKRVHVMSQELEVLPENTLMYKNIGKA